MTNQIPPHPPPTTVEMCTMCKQYAFAYTFHLDQALQK